MGEIFCVRLPDIGEGVVEGEVIEWLKAEGDAVEQDEPVVVVMTDKATVELPAPYPGKIAKHHHQPGEMAERDRPLYDIELSVPAPVGAAMSQEAPKLETPPRTERRKTAPKCCGGQTAAAGVLATPAVRNLARDMGIDLSVVQGTGENGRILKQDLRTTGPVMTRAKKRAGPSVLAGQSTPVWNLPGDERFKLIGFRNYISEKMVEAKYLIPHFAYFDCCDCSRLMQMRERSKAQAAEAGVKLTFMPFFIRALSLTLKQYPVFNSSIDLDTNEHVIHKQHNIGIATKSKDGLIVPVMKNVQDMSFHDTIRAFDILRKKTEEERLESSDMKEATITISNFGSEGGVWATPIVNYPEVCILGLARIREVPVACNGEVVVRPMLNLSWCGDHRVLDGDKMAAFCNHFMRLLENPAQLV